MANDIYFRLLYISLSSLCAACDLKKIKTIFIADLGLSSGNISALSGLSDKIALLPPESTVTSSNTIHSKEWVNAVREKTRILSRIVKYGNVPVVMIDSDTIIMEDFSDLINTNYDIQLCRRSKPFLRPDGLSMDYIASFVAVNTSNALAFIHKWIDRMDERIALNLPPPHETPAMVETLALEKSLKIGYLEDKIVSCENSYIPRTTKIVHAKGRTTHDKISIYRFTNIKRLPYKKIINLVDRGERIPFTLVFFLKKIISIYDIKKSIKKIIKALLKSRP
ncbi:MAG: glycosyltransferase family 77 protein [Treponema sp.]|nr:glycosyltransferase family 77 protein [Treponema sp.]